MSYVDRVGSGMSVGGIVRGECVQQNVWLPVGGMEWNGMEWHGMQLGGRRQRPEVACDSRLELIRNSSF